MELKSRQIVEVYKLKNGQHVLCLISLSPRNMIYYNKQNKPHNSYRWMNEEHWATFENAIESLNIKTNNCKDIKKSVDLTPLVHLNIKTIHSGVGKLCQIADLNDSKVKDVLALKCEIVYKEHMDEYNESDANANKHEEQIPKKHANEAQNKSKREKEIGNLNKVKLDDDLDQQIVCFRITSQNYSCLTPMSSSATINASQGTSSPNSATKSEEEEWSQNEESSASKRTLRRTKLVTAESPTEELPSPPIRQRRTVSKPKRYTEFQTDFVTPSKRSRSPKTEKSVSPAEEQLALKRERNPIITNSKVIKEKSQETPKSYKREFPGNFGSASPRMFINRKRNEILSNKEHQRSMQELVKELPPLSPPKVQFLTLSDMTLDKIMNTLDEIKPKLDSLFRDVSHKDYIKSHGGINHFLVITLISDKIKTEMMKKLGEIYEKDETPKFGSHFLNVLMPEWILTLFMKRHKMKREDAIEHLKAQNVQHVHITGM